LKSWFSCWLISSDTLKLPILSSSERGMLGVPIQSDNIVVVRICCSVVCVFVVVILI